MSSYYNICDDIELCVDEDGGLSSKMPIAEVYTTDSDGNELTLYTMVSCSRAEIIDDILSISSEQAFGGINGSAADFANHLSDLPEWTETKYVAIKKYGGIPCIYQTDPAEMLPLFAVPDVAKRAFNIVVNEEPEEDEIELVAQSATE